MDLLNNYVSVAVAQEFEAILSKVCKPAENRILIISPNDETTTASGIIIPGTVKEDMPRKGVVLLRGEIDEASQSYKELVQTGAIVTYGMYAGKKVEFNDNLFPTALQNILKRSTLSVLSLTEVVLSETNN